jgi:hypothetical protein
LIFCICFAVSAVCTTKRGKVNWGRPGDELIESAVDEHVPAYDSADELFENACGSNSRNTQYDWSILADLTEEDELAMDEIEVAMCEAWIEKANHEQAEVEDEGEEFFALAH